MSQTVDTDKAYHAVQELNSYVLQLYNELTKAKDAHREEIPAEEIQPLFSKVEEFFFVLSRLIQGEKTDERPNHEEPIAEVRSTEERGDDGQSVRASFSEFFSAIGQSVLSVQKSLDESSRAYLDAAKEQRHILPTVFRIPKVSAEMKFAVEDTKEKEVNLIFYKNSKEATSMHQQSVTVEIVAAPPPPEVVERIRSSAPQLDLVLSPQTRSAAFAAIRAFERTRPSTALHTEVLLAEENRDRVLMCEDEPHSSYLLLYANEEKEKNLGVWHLVVAPLNLEAVYLYGSKPEVGENIKPLKRVVIELAEKQAAFLKQMR